MAAVALGPEEFLPLFPPLDKHLGSSLRELGSDITGDDVVRALGLLNYLNIARCCGAQVPRKAVGLEQKWLPQLAQFSDGYTEGESKTLALAALAAARPDLVPAFIGGRALPSNIKPGETFQFNVQGFVRYIAVAMREGAAPEAVEPAWRDFVECFPRKLASQTLRWVDLLWAARAMMEHFERRPAETVAAALHEFLT
jgi:hypothetical protein